jgi:hypothetical protein
MSKRDQKQLFVIYGLLIIVVIASMLVWKGTFGEPKYTREDVTQSVPNWFTEQDVPVESANNGGISIGGVMPETVEQSSNFSGNYTETVNPQR